MVRTHIVRLLCLGACCFVGGCESKNMQPGGQRGAAQRVTMKGGGLPVGASFVTAQDQPFDVTRGTVANYYSGIIGSIPPTANSPLILGIGAFDLEDGTGTNPDQANLQVESGWGYIVSPPRWPIVRTPRKRGGVSAGSTPVPAGSRSYVIVTCSGTVDRIIYLGTFAPDNTPVLNAKLKIEPTPPFTVATCQPLDPGEFAETTLDTTTGVWSGIIKKPVSQQPELAPFIEYVRGRAVLHVIPWPPQSSPN